MIYYWSTSKLLLYYEKFSLSFLLFFPVNFTKQIIPITEIIKTRLVINIFYIVFLLLKK